MKFDRSAPGEGVEVECNLENGKMGLTFHFQYLGEIDGGMTVLTLKDREGQTVLTCLCREPEEEPLQAVLLRPHLWNGMEDPYLYRLDAYIVGKDGSISDRLSGQLPLRSFRFLSEKESYLNGKCFEPKTVNYTLPEADSENRRMQMILEDFATLQELGVNSIYCGPEGKAYGFLCRLCDRVGLLIWPEPSEFSLRDAGDSLLDPLTNRPGILFYHCKAKWSAQPFVYLVPESIHPDGSGTYTATVYSNCGRVALYTDGIFLEFQTGEYEYVFERIPAKHPCVMLAAEADGCKVSLSIPKASLSFL